jgi:chorismate dehydratase
VKRLRISAISFLNTAPLMWDFEHGERARELAGQFEISYTVPSLCAGALRDGEADIGIIPAITYQTIPDLVVIPDIAIAALGAVRSILLVSRKPISEVKKVAVDTSSRTSVALLEILFRKGWIGRKNAPEFIPQPPELEAMLASCDAALLIGDPALAIDRTRYEVIDLAEVWSARTGKPFVFAFWAVRKEALVGSDPMQIARTFQQSRDNGLANVNAIAKEWATRIGISEANVKRYLTKSISYSLARETMAGLELFFELAAEFKLISNLRQIEFLAAGAPAHSLSG